jgi:SAM-dependent methyltransferase
LTTFSSVPTRSTSARCPLCAAASTSSSAFAGTSLLYCADCEFAFLDWQESQQPYGDGLYDDEYFERYLGGNYLAQGDQRRHESRVRLGLLETVTPAPARLLEVGAAAGFFLDEARSRGYEGVGIEPNAAMAAYAREQLDLDVRTGRLGEVELTRRSFDAACAFHVIEHLADPLGAVREMSEHLRPGGHIMIEVPNAQSASARRMGASWRLLDLPHHLGHHSPRSLRGLLASVGLEPVLIDTVPFAHYSPAWRPVARARAALEGMRAGAPPSIKPHPWAHQLLRCIARRPPA